MVCAADSWALASRRKRVRQPVTRTVKLMYSTSAASVITANQASKRSARMDSTSVISISVGRML
ncbi:hypothetical protein D3C71_1554440 [compost metagenome]